jgi:hypothetical protein
MTIEKIGTPPFPDLEDLQPMITALTSVDFLKDTHSIDFTLTEAFLPFICWWGALYVTSRQYLGRAWIVQKVVLARDIVFLLGSFEFGPQTLLETIGWMTSPQQWNGGQSWITFFFGYFSSSSVQSIKTILASRQHFSLGMTWTLEDYIMVIQRRKATDKRDMVFAGLGLVDPASLTINPDIQQQGNPDLKLLSDTLGPQLALYKEINNITMWPVLRADYTTSFPEVIVNCAASLLSGSTGVYALSIASTGFAHIPSWVPDLLLPRVTEPLKNIPSSAFTASTSISGAICIDASCRILSIEAANLDKITRCTPVLEFLTQLIAGLPETEEFLRFILSLQREYSFTGEPTLIALSRTMIADIFRGKHPAPFGVVKEFVGWVQWIASAGIVLDRLSLMGRLRRILKARQHIYKYKDYRREIISKHDLEDGSSSNSSNDSSNDSSNESSNESSNNSSHNSPNDASHDSFIDDSDRSSTDSSYNSSTDYLQAYFDRPRNRKIFVTECGFVGLGPLVIDPGDSVILVAGGYVPYIMRAIFDSTEDADASEQQVKGSTMDAFWLLSEAYVHSIMHGEALSDSSIAFKQIGIL